jgi:hypothetical protein
MREDVAFRTLIEHADNALQNRGLLKPGRGAAMADWGRFASELGESFFQEVKQAGIANTLINAPPRKRLNQDGRAEWGETFAPIACVADLFLLGVCQVRHNLVHGNKQELNERDQALISEAYHVLETAIERSQLLG